MLKRVLSFAVPLAALLVIGPGCGGAGDDDDDDETAICEKAWDTWCACDNVSCSGRPVSCTGPDKTWAECINAADDACAASCD